METIVVGVDGSEPSLQALRTAADLAVHIDDVELVAVFARYAYVLLPEHSAEDMYGDFLDRAEQEVRHRVEQTLADRALRWRIIVREGEPSDVLCQVARETGARFVVAGRRGWSTVAELVLGSVSNRLAHRSDVPVLLVA